MSWEKLKTEYKDIVWRGLKKYNQINNDDGTVSFEDRTEYTYKDESFFGAKDANKMNEAMNYIMAKLENGTNLYSEFLDFFNSQKALFLNSKDGVLSELNETSKNQLQSFLYFIEESRKKVSDTTNNFNDSSLEEIQNTISFLTNVFNSWFEDTKSQLSGDVAGNLKNQIDDIKLKMNNLPEDVVVRFSNGVKSIEETKGSKRIVTEFPSDSEIVQKLYDGQNLLQTKTITISQTMNGSEIRERTINELGRS